MFGYIRPFEDELKVSEYKLYKSMYCGLCRTMGKKLCSASRLTLSYDIVFLALVKYRANESVPTVCDGRCGLCKKKISKTDDVLEYSAYVSAMLNYFKAKDDAADSKGIKSLLSKILAKRFSRELKKSNLGDLRDEIALIMDENSKAEKSGEYTPDSLADYSGRMLGKVFSYGYEGALERITYDIGYHTGRWVYLIDAYDDYFDDIKSKSFTPFKKEPDSELYLTALALEAEMISRSLDLLNSNSAVSVITDNIVHLGMITKAKEISNKFKDKKEKAAKKLKKTND